MNAIIPHGCANNMARRFVDTIYRRKSRLCAGGSCSVKIFEFIQHSLMQVVLLRRSCSFGNKFIRFSAAYVTVSFTASKGQLIG